MAGQLTTRKVETAKPGKYGDGANLYLIVSKTGARKWVLRFTWFGKPKEMGLGSTSSVSLADAREKAATARRHIAQGINPIDERKRKDGIPTFGEVSDEVRQSLSVRFRNEKHKAQWKSTLETYAAPLRAKPIDTIATDDVLVVLKPIWTTKAETASRLRGRIEKILDAAKAKGLRNGENPARWRGHLDHLLPRQSKLARGHHAAMPYEYVAAFITRLRARESLAAQALEASADEAASRLEFGLNQQPHRHGSGVPAAGGQSTKNRAARRRLIEVERLRIELGGEREGPLPVDAQPPGTERLPRRKIF